MAKKFTWFEPREAKEPFEGAIAIANLPVKVIFKHVIDLVVEVDDDGYETKYTGFVMKVLPESFLADRYSFDKIIGATVGTQELKGENMIKKFRKKPVVIEAVQYQDDNHEELAKFLGWKEFEEFTTSPPCIDIQTKEGVMRADLGDWIIKEPFPTDDRIFYPCKPNIFEKTYEEVKE